MSETDETVETFEETLERLVEDGYRGGPPKGDETNPSGERE